MFCLGLGDLKGLPTKRLTRAVDFEHEYDFGNCVSGVPGPPAGLSQSFMRCTAGPPQPDRPQVFRNFHRGAKLFGQSRKFILKFFNQLGFSSV